MFTGMIEQRGRLIKRIIRNGIHEITFQRECGMWDDLAAGESIAVNGVCLTVISCSRNFFTVNISDATMKNTNLNRLGINEAVNMERSLKADSRMGGHFVSGHVDGIGKVVGMQKKNGAVMLKIEAKSCLLDFMVLKGSVAVNGVSLTIQEIDNKSFTVVVIPFTAEHTNIKFMKMGCIVNIEADMLAKYARKNVITI